MTLLLAVLAGIVFIIVGVPILQSMSDLICSFFDCLRAKALLSVAKVNVEIEKLSEELEKPRTETSAIGFSTPEIIYVDEEDDEFSEDKACFQKREIGFEKGKRL